MANRFGYAVGSSLLLFGAVAIGGVLHGVFVRDAFGLTSPAAVFGLLVGVALVGVGRRVERRYETTLVQSDDPDDAREAADAGGTGGADEWGGDAAVPMPFDEDDLEGYERDEPD